ncbi:unnamed protein product, partial [Prunus brigantina]
WLWGFKGKIGKYAQGSSRYPRFAPKVADDGSSIKKVTSNYHLIILASSVSTIAQMMQTTISTISAIYVGFFFMRKPV